ncbi:phage tail protein [Stenotrophomonas sp. MMGLT7]|uniref:phage tail protein n=1 Tax=Stenotrophomonas sp. MMGLT7 TaxID=2901227 RepID=UPI001E64D955|nr:phage tail protein [Stenotrophomonas sp. MMGLT7]MCD7096988.1 phage tail protein [Stenotrophomonas sp. MMGLT7]
MNKLGSLRAALAAAVPELARDPDRMLVFIDQGTLAGTSAPGRSFEYRYTLNLIVTDFAGHPDSIMLPLLDWVRVHQVDLLENYGNHDKITFEVDVLANDKVDLDIKLPLTESVAVAGTGPDTVITHVEEPPHA